MRYKNNKNITECLKCTEISTTLKRQFTEKANFVINYSSTSLNPFKHIEKEGKMLFTVFFVLTTDVKLK